MCEGDRWGTVPGTAVCDDECWCALGPIWRSWMSRQELLCWNLGCDCGPLHSDSRPQQDTAECNNTPMTADPKHTRKHANIYGCGLREIISDEKKSALEVEFLKATARPLAFTWTEWATRWTSGQIHFRQVLLIFPCQWHEQPPHSRYYTHFSEVIIQHGEVFRSPTTQYANL